jgi:2-oxoglutarate ferredoxin oxidoreductase subunit delta
MSGAVRAEIHVIAERCKGCGICVEICQADVLQKSVEANPQGFCFPLVMDANACLGCGMCEMLCPDFAIWVDVVETEEMPS